MSNRPFIQLLKKNIIYFFTLLIDRGASFLMLPVYTYVLMPDEYGVLASCVAVMSISSFVISLGLENGLLRFMQNKHERDRVQSTLFWAMLGSGILGAIGFNLLAPVFSNLLFRTDDYTHLFRITGGILLFDAMMRYYQNRVAGLQAAKKFMYIGLFRGGMTIILTLFFLFVLDMKLEGILLSQLTVSGIVSIVFIQSIRNKIEWMFDRIWFKRILRFSLPMMVTSIFVTAIHFSDRFFVLKMLGLHDAGIYSVSYKLGMLMNMVISAFSISAIPYVAGLRAQKCDPQQLSTLFDRSVLLYAGCFLTISLFLEPILRIRLFGHALIATQYINAVGIVPWILLGYVWYGCFIHLSLGFYDREKTGYLTLITGLSLLLNMGLNWQMIPHMGICGAAIATLITFIFMALLSFLRVRSIWPVKYHAMQNIGIILLASALVLFHFRLFPDNDLISILLVFVFAGVAFISFKKIPKRIESV